jgi:hypothetical protein
VANLSERDLDRIFWGKISTDPTFESWFLQKTKFSHKSLDLVRTDLNRRKPWNPHSRWYTNPDSGFQSETDILLIFRDRETGVRYAFHVENKSGNRGWEENQAKSYRVRADHLRTRFEYDDFQTVLIAPQVYEARYPVEVNHFDLFVSYEELSRFMPEFEPVTATLQFNPE